MFKKKIYLIIILLLIWTFNIINIKASELSLKNKIIYLDPGHGGTDPGSIYKDTYEKDINLSICIKLKENLEKMGAKVYLTRDGDYDLSTEDAISLFESVKGIGLKVASCILLFGFHRFDVYPIDTWVKKYMKDEYNITTVKDIKSFCLERYKEYTGLVIQYMFNYKRNKD